MLQDARHMLRQIARNPGFGILAILIIALGTGAATAVFALVRGVVLRPLPYHDGESLAVVWEDLVRDGNHTYSVTPATWRDIARESRFIQEAAYQQTGGGFVISDGGPAEVIRAGMVSGNFFRTIGVAATLGRTLSPDDQLQRRRVVVLSDALWRRRFGANPAIVGRSIALDGESYVVAGVMPRDFASPWVFKAPHLDAALWTPMQDVDENDRTSAMLQVIVRLRPGITPAAAHAHMMKVAEDIAASHPDTNRGVGLNLVSMREQITGRMRTPFIMLLAGIAALLLIGCTNLASLLLHRTTTRRHEIALRVALGASRARVLVQLLTEHVVLAFLGGMCGVFVAVGGLRILVALAPPDTPRLADVSIDPAVLIFAACATGAVAAILGIIPALRGARDAAGGLRSVRMHAHGRTRAVLVYVQIVLACVLLTGATLLTRSFAGLVHVDPGFDVRNVLTLRALLPSQYSNDPARQNAAMESVLRRVRQIPGVVSAGLTSRPPLDPPFGYAKVNVEGVAASEGATLPQVGYRVATTGYLDALRVPLRAGRTFSNRDNSEDIPVAVVNEAFVHDYLSRRTPLGTRISFGDSSTSWVTIVGVVGDMSNGSLDTPSIPEVFVPYAQNPIDGGTLVVRAAVDARSLTRALQAAIAEVDASIATQDPLTLEDAAAAGIALPRFTSFLVSLFASIALILAMVGIYAIFAQSVATRQRELGIRSALGAPAAGLVRQVLGNGLAVCVAGFATGTLVAGVAARLIRSQLFGISPTDAGSYGIASALMIIVTGLACALPAVRIVRTDPAQVLRSE